MSSLMTTAEAAEFLGVPKATLVRWRCEGVGPEFHKMERLVRYDVEALQRYKQQTLVQPSSVRAHTEDERVAV